MFGIGAGELLFITVLAVLLFGPEKIPEMARKAARVVHWLRNIANNATTSIKKELGPQYQDLTLEDMNPKNLMQKFLLDDIQDELDEMKSSFNEVKGVLDQTKTSAATLSDEMKTSVDTAIKNMDSIQHKIDQTNTSLKLSQAGGAPFDSEAT